MLGAQVGGEGGGRERRGIGRVWRHSQGKENNVDRDEAFRLKLASLREGAGRKVGRWVGEVRV